MLLAREKKTLVGISVSENDFIESPIIRDDTPTKLNSTVIFLYKKLSDNGQKLEDFEYYFKPESNINEKDMNNSDRYCMTYTRSDGENVVLVNKTKKQIITRINTLKLSLQTRAYDYASLYNMRDAIDVNELVDMYSRDISNAKRA